MNVQRLPWGQRPSFLKNLHCLVLSAFNFLADMPCRRESERVTCLGDVHPPYVGCAKGAPGEKKPGVGL